ncbi:MAG: sulfatase [Planctomycetota bacterium]
MTAASTNDTPARRRNVIWVFGDQHRGAALSCAGDPNVSTPNIDRLAAEGVWFQNAVMGFPLCCPCRGSLLTGVYPHRCVPGHQHPLPTDLPTVAQPFNDAGYHTAYIGKWHLDGAQEASKDLVHHIVPPDRRGGFKTWIGYENNNAQFHCFAHGHDGPNPVEHHKLPRFETDALTDLALQQIDTHRDEPFFLALSVQPPHDPYTAPAEWMQRHRPANIRLPPNVPVTPRIREQAQRELAGYYALIENLDHNLGRIRQRLENHGLTDDTYIIFFSDHGDQHGSHGHFRKMTPYQESIHVPFIVAGPTNRHYGLTHTRDHCINHVDVAPTTLGLAGITPPDSMAGTDYSPLCQPGGNLDAPPDSAYLQCVIPTGHPPSIDLPWRGLLTRDRWKYVALEGQPMMLFNLNEDPYEQTNLAWHAHAAPHRKRLNDRLQQWIDDTDDTFALPDL